MIQGACNSSSEFSRMIGQLFSKLPFINFIGFIDDLLLSSNIEKYHLKQLRRLRFILERLEWGIQGEFDSVELGSV